MAESPLIALLKSGTPNRINPPVIVKPQCFTDNEVSNIIERIDDLKQYWSPLSPSSTSAIPTQFLSRGMYSCGKIAYTLNVRVMKELMYQHFSTYYEKIIETVEKEFSLPSEFSTACQYPGFHIFDNITDERQSYPSCNFHKDTFYYLPDIMPVGKIISVIIPLSVPALGGNLLYKLNANRDPDILVYNTGDMYKWPSYLPHSIEAFALVPGERRITCQMHLNVLENKIIIFW